MPPRMYDHDEIERLWRAGEDIYVIAERQECSPDTVRYALGRRGISVTVAARCERLSHEGKTVPEIARAVKRSERRVQRLLDAAGVAPVEHVPDRARVLAMLEDECPYTEVARTFGVSVDWLKEQYPGYGWKESGLSAWSEIRKRFSLRVMHEQIEAMPGAFA